jgi:hypothetical protein
MRLSRKHVLCWPAALAAAGLTFLGAPAQPVEGRRAVVECPAPHVIKWPANKPVWSLCWIAPNASSGVDGSGLELRHMFYKGKEVLYRAHVPCLNVKYDPGGCGGPNLSYRDWANFLVPFEANNVTVPGLYAEPTMPPKTVCDHPGTDKGTFSGVAAEMREDCLILTSQMSAGWYRYVMKWTFRHDGTIEPRFEFTAVENPCVYKPHHHHVYWRLDFDVDGALDNVIEEYDFPKKAWIPLQIEASRMNDFAQHRKWRVRNKGTNRGYEVIPGANDGVADSWGVADVWALRYHPNEIDDGGATGGPNGDAIHVSNYLNKENIDGQDVVLWYRGGHRHVAKAGHIGCIAVGPTLKPFGGW